MGFEITIISISFAFLAVHTKTEYTCMELRYGRHEYSFSMLYQRYASMPQTQHNSKLPFRLLCSLEVFQHLHLVLQST